MKTRIFCLVVTFLMCSMNSFSQKKLSIGDKAPDFTGKDQDGKQVALSDFKGKKVVLYFYPKDQTPGCTQEACNLRDNMGALTSEGYEVLGVSSDDVASHKEFQEKYNLPFSLIADTDIRTYRIHEQREEIMAIFNNDEVEGKWEQVKGTVKDKVGEATGDRELEAEGEVQNAEGETQQTWGKFKRGVGETIDAVGDAISNAGDRIGK